jgi:hypothetical protein
MNNIQTVMIFFTTWCNKKPDDVQISNLYPDYTI